MKLLITILLFTQPLMARDLLLTWLKPTHREDETVLKPDEIKQFNMYWGNVSGDYQQTVVFLGVAESAMVKNLPDDDLYLVLTTVDTDGRESVYSPEIFSEFDIERPDKVTDIIIEP